MVFEYVNPGGFKFNVFHSGQMDFGLSVYNPGGEMIYNSPCALSYESYGLKQNCRYVWKTQLKPMRGGFRMHLFRGLNQIGNRF